MKRKELRRLAHSVALLAAVNEAIADLSRHPDELARAHVARARARLAQWDADIRQKSDPRQTSIFDRMFDAPVRVAPALKLVERRS